MATTDRGPSFAGLFEAAPDVTASAPGRVNLIGEHTDYHDGFVLPMVIPQVTTVELRVTGGSAVRIWSEQIGGAPVEYEAGGEVRQQDWADYARGVTWALRRGGAAIPAFDARITSTVPLGAGLSSSAAFEVSLIRALRQACDLKLDDLETARVARLAETDFVGAPVGIMDQMASSLGRLNHALFIDTRDHTYQHIPMPDNAAIVVIDSGISHKHAGGAYVDRRRESFEAAALLGVETLRDVPADDLARLDALPDVLKRRARHVITENTRVLEAVTALREHDLETLGRLFRESHRSMRDDYEVSTPEIDALVQAAEAQPGVFGARMTGGGFGGAVIALARADVAAIAGNAALIGYLRATRRTGTLILP